VQSEVKRRQVALVVHMIFRGNIGRVSVVLFALMVGCVEPYDPYVDPSEVDLLVIDGFVNATERSAHVRLSHAQPVSALGRTRPETSAKIVIEASTGSSVELEEHEAGEYMANDLTIDYKAFYILHVTTSSGAAYRSDTIRVRHTPEIDSLGFSISSDGGFLNVLVSSHDAQNKTRYYGWDYIETYEYNSPDSSEFKFINKHAIPRTEEEQVFTCWRTEPGSTISIGSTIRLTHDIVSDHILTQIPKGSIKLSARYSVLVKQRTLGEAEYRFLDELRKTTEEMGGIFGVMPYGVLGNIHRVDNPREPVLGYFSGADVTQKRFFIDFQDMPSTFRTLATNDGCIFEETCLLFPEPLTNGPQSCLPIEVLNDNVIILRSIEGNSYIWTSPECGDCRAKGGTTKKPAFW